MKHAIVIVDGAAGWPLAQWGDTTTLEIADIPNLDALAREGMLGMAETVPPQLEPSSNVACTSIVGYDPVELDIGRGAIEGAALGIDLAPGQIAMRLNFCSVDERGRMASYSSDNLEEADAARLAAEVAALDDDTFRLVHGYSFKNILVVTGIPELLEGTYMPPHNIADKEIDPHRPTGPGTDQLRDYLSNASRILAASAVNEERVAKGKLPANTAWACWPGEKPASIVPFEQRYGCRAALSSGVDLLKGIALLCGVDFVLIDGVTDGYDNDYAAQAEGCIAALKDHDVVICHIEAPDTAGHDGNAEEKRRAVEAIDREVIARLRKWGETNELRIVAMPDHPTPVEIKTHSREPVPFVLAGPGIHSNGGAAFTEACARATGTVVDPGFRVMSLLLTR